MVPLASWFGNLSQPVNIYCERTSAAWDAEPLNALSNFAFFIAAWAVWRLQRQRPNVLLRGPIQALAAIIAVVGLGSLTFHTIATRWAEWADVIPILIFMIVYCWLILTAFFGWPFWLKVLTTLAFFAATFYLESDAFQSILWGGAMYLPTLFFMVAAGLRDMAPGRRSREGFRQRGRAFRDVLRRPNHRRAALRISPDRHALFLAHLQRGGAVPAGQNADSPRARRRRSRRQSAKQEGGRRGRRSQEGLASCAPCPGPVPALTIRFTTKTQRILS